MCIDKDIPPCQHDDLIAQVGRQQAEIARLQDRNTRQLATIRELQKQLVEAQRAGKRQAAPFSKGKRATKPRRPGRRPGMGSFSFRKPPSHDELTEPIIDVSVCGDSCPGCGGRLKHEGVGYAYVTDIPPMPRPDVRGYRVQICRCVSCGRRVRGRHGDIAPDQYGASAHRVGTRVMAAAHVLRHGAGVPVRKIPSILRTLTGVKISQSAITQDALRRAKGEVGDAYSRLRASVSSSSVVHTDDTGWRVGGEPAYLMAFDTEEATVYQVRSRHRNEEIRELIPSDYGGVMVTDRGRSYDSRTLSGVKQQKCMAHILRSISETLETKVGRGRSFGKRLMELLREAIELRESERRGEASCFAYESERLKREVSNHLRDRQMPDPDNQRLLNELGRHHDRGNLLRFLDDLKVEPTNNRAERALRGAVIARKVSHCSKTEGGAEAYSMFTSVIRTLARTVEDESLLVDAVCDVFGGAPLPSRSV